MQFIKNRENDPEYLKSVIAHREIVVEQEKRSNESSKKMAQKFKNQLEQRTKQFNHKEEVLKKQILNLTLALQQQETEINIIRGEKSQLEFLLNNTKLKAQEANREHNQQIERVKIDAQKQKELLNLKIATLQKNISDLKKYYKIEEGIMDDKKKIIQDSNRDLKGFSNQKHERMLIIQNQQYKNQIEYQSKNLTIQLQRNQKLSEEIKNLKIEVNLHKDIENDLVKRSSLAQSLIKKLYKEIQELKSDKTKTTQNRSLATSNVQTPESNPQSQRSSRVSQQSLKSQSEIINKLNFEIANLKNHNHYLENIQKIYSRKYETLGSIMADYLENLLYSKQKDSESELEGTNNQISINLVELKAKDIKQWSFEQLQVILSLLLSQIKPFISKDSLIKFPEAKNINISFVQQAPKQMISLPKIADNYEKSSDKQIKKGANNRFRDIPIDISTKILRSNLREWGAKVNFGLLPNKKIKSKSIMHDQQKSML